MNALAELYLQRSETELVAAQILFETSQNEHLQKEQFKIEKNFTFYSSVISHAYYSIFYLDFVKLMFKYSGTGQF